jgi:hypothetical protein
VLGTGRTTTTSPATNGVRRPGFSLC